MSKLNVKQIKAIKKPGMHGDGQGLYLRVAPAGTKSWILRVTVRGQKTRHEIGLGSVETLSLAEAREKARELRAEAKKGRDPRSTRDHRTATLEEVARDLHESLSPRFTDAKHKAQWISVLENHAFPKIGNRPIENLQRHDVFAVLEPIWLTMNPTGRRLKHRLSAVFNYAIGKNQREAASPMDGVLASSLKSLIKKPLETNHHKALAWRDIPAFMERLEERPAMSAKALRFIILTAARSNEARGAAWDELDFDQCTRTVPAERMKAREEHRVPLSDEAMEILDTVRGLHPKLVFPSGQGRQLSVNVFRPLFRRMGCEGLTAHGFRSSFRDWCAEYACADREIAELALAHTFGSKTERAYRRTDLFERRRALMDSWGRYATGQSSNVLNFQAHSK